MSKNININDNSGVPIPSLVYPAVVEMKYNLSICSYNCRSIKNSTTKVYALCSQLILWFIQDHQLLPSELGILSTLHDDFHAHGTSAVDMSNDICNGRAYGGTAILYNNALGNAVNVVECNTVRCTAVTIGTNVVPLLIVNVYMPSDYGTANDVEDYLEVCASIKSLYRTVDAVHLIVVGDFNCSVSSRFYSLFQQFVDDNNLVRVLIC